MGKPETGKQETASGPVQPGSHFKDDLDSDLLEFMTVKGDPNAHAAGEEFFRRHRAYVVGALRKAAPTHSHAEDIAQNTFSKAYFKAETYKPLAGLDREADRRRVRAWLMAIARNRGRDLSKLGSANAEFIADLQAWQQAEDMVHLTAALKNDGGSTVPSLEERRLETALQAMSKRERDVLLTTMEYKKPGAKHQKLPDDVSAELAARWKTTPDNIRAVRKRGLEKAKELLEQPTPSIVIGGRRQ